MRSTPASPVFSRAEAHALGWSDSALTRAVRSGRLTRLHRGYFTTDREPSHILFAVAASLACLDSAISHRSALIGHCLPLLGAQPMLPELTVPPFRIGSADVAHIYRAQLRPEDVIEFAGTCVTSVRRTVVDVARLLGTAAGVVAMDAALQRGLTTVAEIEDVIRYCWNWPRLRPAHRAIRLCDGLAESPLESISRLAFRRLNLPAPQPQVRIFDASGRELGRADFYWDEFGVVGEADGRDKYSARDVLTREKLRQEDFENVGLVVARWGWDDAFYARPVLKQRVERSFLRGLARDRSGFRRLWSVG